MKHTRYVLLTFIVGAILMGMVAQSALVSIFAQAAMPDQMLGPFASSSVAGMVVAFVTGGVLLRHERAKRFTDEVVGELLRVTWPTRDETVRATVTVVFTTLFVAALLGIYDLIWKNLADLVLFTEG